MTAPRGLTVLAGVALACLAVLVTGVIWASGRGLELMDEAYYLLSALHPEQVQLYISAQHWVLAPLWGVTGSLQGFRLIGAALLLGASALLALGVLRAIGQVTGQDLPVAGRWLTVAAAGIGALMYVATIAPSPSYNLLASAGAYAALGLALMALTGSGLTGSGAAGLLGGVALAVCFVAKPSAGVSVGLVVAVVVLVLRPDLRGWATLAAGLTGAGAMLALLVALQPRVPAVLDSLQGGLDLFRMVQTEPVAARLVRYATTLLTSLSEALRAFWAVVLLLALWLRYPRPWLLGLVGLATLATLYGEKSLLGGSQSYHRMAEAIYVGVGVITGLATLGRHQPVKAWLLVAALICLPFATTIGTGNALFTQVIVALAPWTVVVAVLATLADSDARRTAVQLAATGVLLVVLTAQITTSYLRDPYHLARPLTGQTVAVEVPDLGRVLVDPETASFLDQIAQARTACALDRGAAYFGLYNIPGVALTLAAVPPVTPWLNTAEQAETVLRHWSPGPGERVVIVLTPKARANRTALPPALRPSDQARLCGHATTPHEGLDLEIWATLPSAG